MSFAKDLKIGKSAETAVSELLKLHGIHSFPYDKISHDISFDFGGEAYSAEIKYDLYASKSGNVAIEYWNPKLDKPSGLSATESDIWIFVFEDLQIYGANTMSLKKFTEEYVPFRRIIAGGDKNANLLLYKKRFVLDKVFKRLDNIPVGQFDTALRGILS